MTASRRDAIELRIRQFQRAGCRVRRRSQIDRHAVCAGRQLHIGAAGRDLALHGHFVREQFRGDSRDPAAGLRVDPCRRSQCELAIGAAGLQPNRVAFDFPRVRSVADGEVAVDRGHDHTAVRCAHALDAVNRRDLQRVARLKDRELNDVNSATRVTMLATLYRSIVPWAVTANSGTSIAADCETMLLFCSRNLLVPAGVNAWLI